MDATAMTLGSDALWSLSVIAVVVGPPAVLVAIVVWVARRIARMRTARVPRLAARPSARAARS